MQEYNKIIKEAAKKILTPHGLFQNGTSKTWLEDNGWFFIVVGFEPVDWLEGSALSVGICFLWEASEGLNGTLTYSYGGRLDGFCEYDGDDDKFQAEMERTAERALQKVMEYRRFTDMDHAKKCLEQEVSNTREEHLFWELYKLAMICFLRGDFEEGITAFDKFVEILKNGFYVNGFYIEWKEEFYDRCIHSIKPCLTSKEAAQKMVLDMINRRRNFFKSKPPFKKMNDNLYVLPLDT
ncbi:MAG: hypothetical protein NC086_01840 [Alistipes sp.]|nr:hypothetical protein [Alistipes sp.]